jgi:hypothetical protein
MRMAFILHRFSMSIPAQIPYPMHLPCLCPAYPMHVAFSFRYIPCIFDAYAIHIPCISRAYPMHVHVSCVFHAEPLHSPGISHAHPTHILRRAIQIPCIFVVITYFMRIPYQCHAYSTHILCIFHAYGFRVP